MSYVVELKKKVAFECFLGSVCSLGNRQNNLETMLNQLFNLI